MRGVVSARFLTIVAGSLLITTWPAFADANAPEEGDTNKSNLFGKIDRNGDGIIDRTEVDAWRQTIFMRIDANGDQMISLDEWQTVQDRMQRRRDQRAANENTAVNPTVNTAAAPTGSSQAVQNAASRPASVRAQKMFGMLDANGDSKISLDEWRAAGDRLFDRRDVNKDGKIGRDEFAMKSSRQTLDPVP